jgi:metal-sulfur cluster biosynthetic enzyme
MSDALKQQILDQVNQIPDPCSMSQAMRIGLADMGLVTEVQLSEPVDAVGRRNVSVSLRVTAPGCMYVPFMDRAIRTALEELQDVAEISTVWQPTGDWTPDDIAEPVKLQLAEARARRRKLMANRIEESRARRGERPNQASQLKVATID